MPTRETTIFMASGAFIPSENVRREMAIVIILLILYGKEADRVNRESTVFN
jgi:hypothetical protein